MADKEWSGLSVPALTAALDPTSLPAAGEAIERVRSYMGMCMALWACARLCAPCARADDSICMHIHLHIHVLRSTCTHAHAYYLCTLTCDVRAQAESHVDMYMHMVSMHGFMLCRCACALCASRTRTMRSRCSAARTRVLPGLDSTTF